MTEQEKITEMCRQHFETHQASLIQDTDRYLIIDWRRRDGSGNCYVNYIVDKKRGSLIVSGDLGDSIATWFNPLEPSKLRDKFVSKEEMKELKDTIRDIKTSIDDIKENTVRDKDFIRSITRLESMLDNRH